MLKSCIFLLYTLTCITQFIKFYINLSRFWLFCWTQIRTSNGLNCVRNSVKLLNIIQWIANDKIESEWNTINEWKYLTIFILFNYFVFFNQFVIFLLREKFYFVFCSFIYVHLIFVSCCNCMCIFMCMWLCNFKEFSPSVCSRFFHPNFPLYKQV